MKRQFHCLALLLVCVLFSAPMADQAASAPAIPVCPGLTVVTAIESMEGDYESIKTIQSVDAKEVHMKYSAEVKDSDWSKAGPAQAKAVVYQRTMLIADLQSANMYQQVFLDKSAEMIPGTTSIGTSAAVLRDLNTKGETSLSISNAYAGLELTADRGKVPNYYSYMQAGKIRKVGTTRVPVLLNDEPVDLPAIRAQGEMVSEKVEFLFLEDERNPLTLAFRIGIGDIKPLTPDEKKICDAWRQHPDRPMPVRRALTACGGGCDKPNGGDCSTLRVIKIDSRCTGPAAALNGKPGGSGLAPGATNGATALEQALSQKKKVDIYSIYFSFNSDAVRIESQPTLKDIAEVMRRHPDWKLQVNGHTDGIGGDQFNLDLSRRRAAAVKDALVSRFKIGGDRLATAGYGKSQPKDTNDTLEGRARNRRVELVKIS